MPHTDCAAPLENELALMLPDVAPSVLPILLLLMVVVPAAFVRFIPYMFTAFVFGVLIVVIEPMVFFWQLTVPVLGILMPYNDPAEAVVASSTIDPVPVAAPIVLAVILPAFTAPANRLIPYHDAFELFF